MGGQEDGQCDGNMALALQDGLKGNDAHPLALNSCRKNTKLHPASNETCHGARQRMMVVKDTHIQDFPSTHWLTERAICIVTENPGNAKRKKILVDIEDYNNLRKKLADKEKTNNFLQSSSNF